MSEPETQDRNSGSLHCYVAALFVQPDGCYADLPYVDAWDADRDATKYEGPMPVVAHPPCQLWGNFAIVNFARWGGEHNRPGNDGGCFEAAVEAVDRWGGVLVLSGRSLAMSVDDWLRMVEATPAESRELSRS